MPSFRSARSQAERAVSRAKAIGKSRHRYSDDGLIHSLGSARNYREALTRAAAWDRENGGRGIQSWNRERAISYLSERAEIIGQKGLDLDRQALSVLPGVGKLDRVRSEIGRCGLAEQTRAYTNDQIRAVIGRQSERHSLASELAHSCGLRAHELLTLRTATERPASAHRSWSQERFVGRTGEVYTVQGKGGLVREVLLPTELAIRLEAQRLNATVRIVDRGIRYDTAYAIGGGQAWSQSWAAASRSALGWSTGAHGLRHTYAQQRMNELQSQGMTYRDALGVVSQEMGHFRGDITKVYLR